MRYVMPFLTLLHGLAHTLGFIKAFQPNVLPQFTKSITKTYGIGWLLAAALFCAAAGLGLFDHPFTWLLLLFAIILSEALILTSWADARFGTIPNVMLLLWALIGFATWNYHRAFMRDVTANLTQPSYFDQEILSEQDLAPLPPPVQRYIRYTGAVGKPKVNNFRVDFTGQIRSRKDSIWMPFESRQHNFLQTPTRLFFLKATMKGLSVAGYHRYNNGRATMDIRLLSLIRVQYTEGEDMNIAETVTFFNDMCFMAPATLIDRRITWLESDPLHAKARFSNNGIAITATLVFNDEGQLVNFESFDRYNTEEKKRMRWTTPVKEYSELNGYRLGTRADAVYSYEPGDFSYGEFRMTRVEYNLRDFAPK